VLHLTQVAGKAGNHSAGQPGSNPPPARAAGAKPGKNCLTPQK